MDTLKYLHINWVTSLWLMCTVPFIACILFLIHIYCSFLLNVGSLCAWNPVYYCYLHLHMPSQILRAGSVNRGEWSRFYLQNKAFMRIIAHMLQLYPFLYLSFKESFLNSKGKLLQKYESFSSSYSRKLGRGQVSCILQQTWDFKLHCHFLFSFL